MVETRRVALHSSVLTPAFRASLRGCSARATRVVMTPRTVTGVIRRRRTRLIARGVCWSLLHHTDGFMQQPVGVFEPQVPVQLGPLSCLQGVHEARQQLFGLSVQEVLATNRADQLTQLVFVLYDQLGGLGCLVRTENRVDL